MIVPLGEISALITSVSFSATSTLFTLAGRRVGSITVNRIRLLIAILFLTTAHFVFRIPLPVQAEGEHWFWLGISGVIGLVLGDAFLFQAFVQIGPRLSMLMMSLAPVLAAALAWVFFGETLVPGQIFGIFLTLSGIAWVILESNGHMRLSTIDRRNFTTGILFGLGGATGQALGLITAKQGLGSDFPALSGTLIRMISAASVLWAYTLLRGQARQTFENLRQNRGALVFITAGAFSGPFLGVTFSLLAIQLTEVGVASTLMALPPVFLLPISYFVFKERFGWQAILGTLIAMCGVALLFLL